MTNDIVSETLNYLKSIKDTDEFKQTFVQNLLTDEGFNDLIGLIKLRAVAFNFINEYKVSCAEATVSDKVYIHAPLLVEQMAEIVGYYKYEDEENNDE